MNLKSPPNRILILLFVGTFLALGLKYSSFTKAGFINQYALKHAPSPDLSENKSKSFYDALAAKAEDRLKASVTYDGRYYKIGYPMGDVPSNIGVCTDVVIRSYRALGIDLQEKVHIDMKNNFLSYPKMWGLTSPDTNIDHRRVPNLMTFFNRSGAALPITNNPVDYGPGHVVAWDLGGGIMHIGIVSSKKSSKSGNPLIVHNIGLGPKLEDILFYYKIIGYYKYGAPDA